MTSRGESNRERLERLLVRERALRTMGYARVAGVDEAGRGPLAGPVVAAAAILADPDAALHDETLAWLEEVFDSKQLTAAERDELFTMITADGSPFQTGVGIRDHLEIDRVNILKATMAAMGDAVVNLILLPDYLLVDGTKVPNAGVPGEPVVKGDSTCLSIAAASIVAKVTRDRIMIALAEQYPQYGFTSHKGYGTPEHIEAIRRHGRSPVHRRSFTIAAVDRPEFEGMDGGGGGA